MADPIAETLAKALVQALRQLGEAGRSETDNRIAAVDWSGIRRQINELLFASMA